MCDMCVHIWLHISLYITIAEGDTCKLYLYENCARISLLLIWYWNLLWSEFIQNYFLNLEEFHIFETFSTLHTQVILVIQFTCSSNSIVVISTHLRIISMKISACFVSERKKIKNSQRKTNFVIYLINLSKKNLLYYKYQLHNFET